MNLTVTQLARCTGANTERAARWWPHLTAAMQVFNITTGDRVAAFLPQVGHESGHLLRVRESLNYSPEGALATFGARISEAEARRYCRTAEHPADQVAIANIVYGGAWGAAHLGNTQPGDGARFIGRDLMQTTGRGNYARTRDGLRAFYPDAPDFVERPEQLEHDVWAARSPCYYWHSRGLNELADQQEFMRLTRRINAAAAGYEERFALYQVAREALGLPQ